MQTISYPEFNKIPRLNRECVITEKLDGTNGLIYIGPEILDAAPMFLAEDGMRIYAGSKSRWLDTSSQGDNYGFAKWVADNAEELINLGPGHHYGEWWGRGIQHGYGLSERRFSLFNTYLWTDNHPKCCHVVPILHKGLFNTHVVEHIIGELSRNGSRAAPGQPAEGVIVYHDSSKQYFKVTCQHDDEPKNAHPKKERKPQVPRTKTAGGRRKEQIAISFPDRRKSV